MTFARARRQYPGHQTRETAIITLRSPGPSAAAKAMARIRSGMVRKMSVVRMIPSPSRPPKNPATAPSKVPTVKARTMTTNPATSETRAPTITRVKTSRPA